MKNRIAALAVATVSLNGVANAIAVDRNGYAPYSVATPSYGVDPDINPIFTQLSPGIWYKDKAVNTGRYDDYERLPLRPAFLQLPKIAPLWSNASQKSILEFGEKILGRIKSLEKNIAAQKKALEEKEEHIEALKWSNRQARERINQMRRDHGK